jgi:hypothetical protein
MACTGLYSIFFYWLVKSFSRAGWRFLKRRGIGPFTMLKQAERDKKSEGFAKSLVIIIEI